MEPYVLLVEGNDDQDFFKAYCELIGKDNVKVIPPKTLDISSGDGWSNLVKNLPLLLDKIKAGDVEKFGIVLDADHPPNNKGGFSIRFQLVTEKLAEFGYIIPKKPSHKTGDIFIHSDGLPSIGLWIMPDHQSNGMLEDFVADLVLDATQISLLNHAEQSIKKLPITLFDKTLHLTKSKVYTWRAWQKRPGIPLSKALQDGILDRSKSVSFEDWLKIVFK